MHDQIDAREYKLLLESAYFGHAPSLDAANGFWDERLKPIIDVCLDRSRRGARHERRFDRVVERTIRFYDTADHVLNTCDYALRVRTPSKGRAELTLKLRMPDLFVVAATELPTRSDEADPVFEEDIAPLEVADPEHPGGVTIASPPSIRSRFALSSSQSLRPSARLRTLGDVFRLFPTLKANLQASGGAVSPRLVLRPGPVIRETVFRGARVRFGDGITGKLVLTHWHFDDPLAPISRIAEVSYCCETTRAPMSGEAARRALNLFLGMQEGLRDLVNLRHASKTALALP